MADFNIVPEIGGVDTSDPSAHYDPIQQHIVLRAVFGPNNPSGSLILPDGSPLYVGRSNILSCYSNGRVGDREPYDLSLFTPAYDSRDGMTLIEVVPPGGFDGNGFDTLDGFVPTAFGMVLMLGRQSMLELVTGERQEFSNKISSQLKERRDYLARLVIFEVLYNSSELGAEEDWLAGFEASIDDLIGDRLVEIERSMPDEHPYSLAERPFESFVIEMSNRLCEIVERPVAVDEGDKLS